MPLGVSNTLLPLHFTNLPPIHHLTQAKCRQLAVEAEICEAHIAEEDSEEDSEEDDSDK